jgi:hypothetical protein
MAVAAAVRSYASASPGFAGSSAASAARDAGLSPSSRRVTPADWTPTATRALTRTPTPATQWMCQNPATTPTKAEAWAVALATATVRELVLRRRNVSCRLTSTRAARSGIAIAKATAQTIPEVSRGGSGDERLHQDDADCYQPAVGQVVLPDPLLLQLRVLRDVLHDPFGFVLLVFLEPLGFAFCVLFEPFGLVFCVLGHGHHRGVGTP